MKKLSVRTRFAIIGIVSTFVAVGAATGSVLVAVRTDLKRQANDFQDAKIKMLHELVQAKGTVRMVEGKLIAGDHVINGNYEIVDLLQSIAGGTATIFMGDERVSTNVMKDDGTRAVGTKLQGIARDVVIGQGIPYRGEADILGVSYFTAYNPIKDQNGKQVGVLYVGVKQDEFFRSFRTSMILAITIGGIMALALAALLIYSTREYDRAMKEVSRLAGYAQVISTGESLEDQVRTTRQDELGDLARAIERMRLSMRAALESLGAGG